MKQRLQKQAILNELNRLGSIELVATLDSVVEKEMTFKISKPMIFEDGKVVRQINDEQFSLETVGNFIEYVVVNLKDARTMFNGQDSKLTQLV